jgi:hypothetical protein
MQFLRMGTECFCSFGWFLFVSSKGCDQDKVLDRWCAAEGNDGRPIALFLQAR